MSSAAGEALNFQETGAAPGEWSPTFCATLGRSRPLCGMALWAPDSFLPEVAEAGRCPNPWLGVGFLGCLPVATPWSRQMSWEVAGVAMPQPLEAWQRGPHAGGRSSCPPDPEVDSSYWRAPGSPIPNQRKPS